MKKPWRVRFHNSNRNYEEILDDATEAAARKRYDRVKQHQFLAYCMIFNRLEAVANRLSALALEAITSNPKLKKEWKKLKAHDQAQVEALFRKGAIELIKDATQ